MGNDVGMKREITSYIYENYAEASDVHLALPNKYGQLRPRDVTNWSGRGHDSGNSESPCTNFEDQNGVATSKLQRLDNKKWVDRGYRIWRKEHRVFPTCTP